MAIYLNFDERLSLFVKLLQLRNYYFFYFGKLSVLFICVQDEEFLIIEENGE